MPSKIRAIWLGFWLTLYAIRMLTPNAIGAHTFGGEVLMLPVPFVIDALREVARR